MLEIAIWAVLKQVTTSQVKPLVLWQTQAEYVSLS